MLPERPSRDVAGFRALSPALTRTPSRGAERIRSPRAGSRVVEHLVGWQVSPGWRHGEGGLILRGGTQPPEHVAGMLGHREQFAQAVGDAGQDSLVRLVAVPHGYYGEIHGGPPGDHIRQAVGFALVPRG